MYSTKQNANTINDSLGHTGHSDFYLPRLAFANKARLCTQRPVAACFVTWMLFYCTLLPPTMDIFVSFAIINSR